MKKSTYKTASIKHSGKNISQSTRRRIKKIKSLNIGIVGTVGLPSKYGGFETLVDNLVVYHKEQQLNSKLNVYCSSLAYSEQKANYLNANLIYIKLKANGIQSIIYDAVSITHAVWNRSDVILLLGVSGALLIPVIRLFSKTKIVTNIDGIEWRRQKWNKFAQLFLRLSELLAVRYSHAVIADNLAVSDYVQSSYGLQPHVIAYGGDHAVKGKRKNCVIHNFPKHYCLVLCRIEPENNISMILQACIKINRPLVVVGNWEDSAYGRQLKRTYSSISHYTLLNPIYKKNELYTLRKEAAYYIHGHSAGGTNPALVEMMHFGCCVLAYDCSFNRTTTHNAAFYFKDINSIQTLLNQLDVGLIESNGKKMQNIAKTNYTWDNIGGLYFKLMENI